jgi:hypothetical protein
LRNAGKGDIVLPASEETGMSEKMPALLVEQPMPSAKTPIFVVGPFRSGTSLLYALLNQHPQIALMYECDVWNFPQILSRLRFQGDWRERLEFYGRSLSRHRLILGNSLSGLENVRTPLDLYRVYAETKQARFFGEKSPFYCDRLVQLAQTHPGCAFILIWRDPVEIFRSVQDAASNNYYFRRHGMMSRLIFYQEKMIHQAARLARSGGRIHHVTYNNLVDHTDESCRAICRFLEIEFDKKMLDLTNADLSAVFRAPQFEFLRRGVIERRRFSNHGADQRAGEKLERFHHRWNRLCREKLGLQTTGPSGPEPGLLERLYHRWAGSILCGMDTVIRVSFEFLPLPWLRTYRQAKAWFKAGRNAVQVGKPSFINEFRANLATVLLSVLILIIVAIADHLTGVAVSLMPFYIIPAAIMTLVISQRWGTIAAATSALTWTLVQNMDNPYVNFSHPVVCLWDAFMRFLVIEIVVLLLERIRLEIGSKQNLSD